MYTLAIDRGDEQVAHLYDPLHPAVLRLIQFARPAALRARIPVSICGEMAGDPASPRCSSDSASAICRWRQATTAGQAADSSASTGRSAVRCANLIMGETDPSRIEALLDDVNEAA